MYRNTMQKGLEAIEAINSTGAFVHVNPDTFLEILTKTKQPILIKTISSSLFRKQHQYLTVYRELYFFTESEMALKIPDNIEPEFIDSERMWIPRF